MKLKHNKGVIRDNFMAAIVQSDVYKPKKEKAKRGKGSYSRKTKHKKIPDHRRGKKYKGLVSVRQYEQEAN